MFDISTIKNNLFRVYFSTPFKSCMGRITNKCYKIFNTVIIFNLINMMDWFIRFKIPSKIFLHYKPMFRDITIRIMKGMIRAKNNNISITSFIFTALPLGVFFSNIYFKFFHCVTYFNLGFLSRMMSYFCTRTTPNRIILTGKFFPAINTIDNFCHFITLKIKAAFGGLKETVMFPHLRRQIITIKNLFPSSNYIIVNNFQFVKIKNLVNIDDFNLIIQDA